MIPRESDDRCLQLMAEAAYLYVFLLSFATAAATTGWRKRKREVEEKFLSFSRRAFGLKPPPCAKL